MQFEDLRRGAIVDGIVPGEPVTLISAEAMGPDSVEISYRTQAGDVGQEVLDADAASSLSAGTGDSRWTFDADGDQFRLGVEAMRIRDAAMFDPMLAVSTSEIQPLPHQIRAVYSDMLPKPGSLRFLLADDPGAGKTIMAGLYIKELLIRGDLKRCLIVAPGGLVDQWQEELSSKFSLNFRILSPGMIEESVDGNPFTNHPLLIARMDQLARNEDLLEALGLSDWDLVVVDEAHRMSASFYGAELKKTKRYELGQLLGSRTRHFLLMTATPHAGKEEDYQLFLALLDPDRFEGKYREGVHSTDTSMIMRRMVKEDLLTFEGKPLFTERIAQTVPYNLTPAEMDLYEAVTEYVRTEMGRADKLKADGQGRRSNTVGFALTVLQRRLASSPRAIWRSLQRRTERLRTRKQELQTAPVEGHFAVPLREAELERMIPDTEDFDDMDYNAEELEELEETVLDAATTARTVAELDAELAVLANLEIIAGKVHATGEDRKWVELRKVLNEAGTLGGVPRKVIVFTEHRDTLAYLQDKVTSFLGNPENIEVIHGGTSRKERKNVRDRFANDPVRRVLLATDAAGEGLNLQCAHLMVNYDLPWNPNRIEQRFGRIHRIGQTEVCRLWNLVAIETREGQVFNRLLSKIEEQRKAYGGRIFDVLGEHAFTDTSLRTLLLEAIRYGEDPVVRDRLNRVIDESAAEGIDELRRENALVNQQLQDSDVEEMRRLMDEAQARKLQPYYIEEFFQSAFTRFGGRSAQREAGRFEISNVPAQLRERATTPGRLALGSVAQRYARLTCDPEQIKMQGEVTAELLAPGHPLLDAVIEATIEASTDEIKTGATLVWPTPEQTEPRLVVGLSEEMRNGAGQVLSRRFSFVSFAPDGVATPAGTAPHRDVEALPANDGISLPEAVLAETKKPWLGAQAEQDAVLWAHNESVPAHKREVALRVDPVVSKTRALVKSRLSAQINYWVARAAKLADDQAAGRKVRIAPSTAKQRAAALEHRLTVRERELNAEARVSVQPPRVTVAWLVVPQSWATINDNETAPMHAVDTTVVDRRAVDAVLAAERTLGREPQEMHHSNEGYDVESRTLDGHWLHIEVKGRILGSDTIFVSSSQVNEAKNRGDKSRLAIVCVHPDGPELDEVRYTTTAFKGLKLLPLNVAGVHLRWKQTWEPAQAPF